MFDLIQVDMLNIKMFSTAGNLFKLYAQLAAQIQLQAKQKLPTEK